MTKQSTEIYYLYHSGFAVKTLDYLLIFDYFKDIPDKGERSLLNGVITKELLQCYQKVIVFCSHSHEDHFNPVILQWENDCPTIQYVFSSEICMEEKKENYHFLPPYTNLQLGDVFIKTYGSTDIGVSFFLKIGELSLFHAGDLNWWHWKEDSIEERHQAEAQFKKEIEKLKQEKIDIAFFPVDPRLEEYYAIGATYFMKELLPSLLIPMHFADDFSATNHFEQHVKMLHLPTNTISISHRGENFLYHSRV